jgi:1-acyl-sn-glycerol-3-phosphate acyltransferase
MTVGVRMRVIASFLVMTVGSVVMLAVAIPTLGLARRFYSEVIARRLGQAVLALWGIRLSVRHVAPVPTTQCVFISNHTSTLDVFLLIGMPHARMRFFLGGWLRKYPPFAVVGTLIRIFWTVPQEFPERRRQIFARASRVLARTGDSVYLSPEGMRVATGEIGHFNKGAFHLATSLGAPIVPIYFHIPPAIDPKLGYDARPGVVDLYFLPAIETSSWSVDEVEHNRDRVRAFFVRVHDSMRETGRLPRDLALDGGRTSPQLEEAPA